MRRCRSWYRIRQLLQGTLLAGNGCLDRVVAAGPRGQRPHPAPAAMRRVEGRCGPAGGLGGGPGTGHGDLLRAAAGLGSVLECVPPGPEPPPPLVLAEDPTHPRDRLVAWHLVPAQTSLSWMDILCHLLDLLAPTVPTGMEVHVLCEIRRAHTTYKLLSSWRWSVATGVWKTAGTVHWTCRSGRTTAASAQGTRPP